MIIRSQDKKIVTKFDSVSIVANYKRQYKGERKIVGYQLVVFIGFNIDVIVGQYSTEEKAIKVLDDICSFANGLHFEKIATDQCGRLDGVVFQMPQDSEV